MRGREQELLRVIREKCLDCSGGSKSAVKACTVRYCPLYNYRTADAREKSQLVKGQMYLEEMIRR